MRIYGPIWEELKKKNQVSIQASPIDHKKIIKAVTKLKWEDSKYKKSLAPYRTIMEHASKGAVLTFTLRKVLGRVTIGDI